MNLHYFIEIVYLTIWVLQLAQQSMPTVQIVSREVAYSRTAGIFIRNTTFFHCDSLNYIYILYINIYIYL